MAIQSSINSLLSQAQSLAAFYTGFKKADDIIEDTTAARGEAQIQTDIAAGNAPMKDGEVDTEWLKKRRDEMFNLSSSRKHQARILRRVEDYLKSFAVNSELKNEVAENLARGSVEARTNSINQSKSNFDEHVASLIRYYGKGSGNP